MFTDIKILVVDDDERKRSLLVDVVKRKAQEILECSNGIDALGEYSINQQDYVLIDMHMKSLDGYTTTGLIHQFYPNAKILLVSKNTSPVEKEKAQQAGASAVISEDSLSDILNYINH